MPTEDTNIGWTDDSWNPVHGCHKISEGCANCYAAVQSQRFNHTDHPWTVQHAEENVRLQEHHLEYPLEKEPRRIFVNSMSDLFHPEVSDEYIHRIMDVIEEADQHVFQALTKHGADNGRLAEWERWPENLWMGVTVEKHTRKYRIDELRKTDAVVKWISFEPLVGPVSPHLEGIDWAVVGGESGDGHRDMDHAWARFIRRKAAHRNIPYFFKQSAGEYPETGTALARAPFNSYEEATLQEGSDGVQTFREFPDALTDDLEEARPDLVEQVEAPMGVTADAE